MAKKGVKAPKKKPARPAGGAAKKSAKKVVKKGTKVVSKKAALEAKKTPKKSKTKKRTSSLATAGKKKTVKKVLKTKTILVKDKETKQANAIANTEKKKSARSLSGKTKTKRPVKTASDQQTTALIDAVIDGMQEKKAKNITIINLSEIENSVADFFVICDADSKTHVEAIADSVDEIVTKETGERPFHAEGYENAEWILIDYINVVVHVFQKETRHYYNLEALWADAEITFA
ncbi:MAG TPA: ribosome silencing factor [Bacteroidia bacterium]|jgi:ribosome-associated protein|nr:ribosome silencing factor [Bacteroidia bacterium]